MLSSPNKENKKRGKVGRTSISSFRCDADVLLSSETERGFVQQDFGRAVCSQGVEQTQVYSIVVCRRYTFVPTCLKQCTHRH